MTSTLLQCPTAEDGGGINSSSVTKLDLQAVVRGECRRRRRERIIKYCRNFIACLCSHVGLASLVVSYSIVGAFLFQALEAPYEGLHRKKIVVWKKVIVEDIWKLAQTYNTKENFTNHLMLSLDKFQEGVFEAIKDTGWDGRRIREEPIYAREGSADSRQEVAGSDLRWSYAGSLLYCVTVITTIGYGHLAPKTSVGRFLTILYAIIGIPLTFLYLTNVGNFLADSFRLFYRRVCCDICCCRSCERKRRREIIKERRKLFKGSDIKRRMAFTSDTERSPSVPFEKVSPPASCHEFRSVARNDSLPQLPHTPSITPSITLMDTDTLLRPVLVLPDNGPSSPPLAGGVVRSAPESISPSTTFTSSLPVTPKGIYVDDLFRYDSIINNIKVAFQPELRETDILNSDSEPETSRNVSPFDIKETDLVSDSDSEDDKKHSIPSFYLPSETTHLMLTSDALACELDAELKRNKPEVKKRKRVRRSRSCKRKNTFSGNTSLKHSASNSSGSMYCKSSATSPVPQERNHNNSSRQGWESCRSPELRRTLSTKMGTRRSKKLLHSSNSTESGRYRKSTKRLPEIMTNIEEGDDDAFDCEFQSSPKKVTVPICICLLIIATYIFGGSILFTLWEDWDYLTGSYFCFITLSTIGFGDIVPGTDMKEWASQEKLVLCSLWLAFGLSLLAMCFNLMQEEVKEKGKWVGEKVGLIKNKRDS